MSCESLLGKEIENYFYNVLEIKTRKRVIREKEIRKMYSHITGIDYLIEHDNCCYCFQVKWSKKTISNCQINHFISCMIQLQKEYPPNYKFISIYISKKKLSKPANDIKNKSSIELNSIYDEDITIIINKLDYLLHSYKIWTYDEHCDAIMIIN